MGKFASALPLSQWWNGLWIRYYFKFVLPKIEFAELDGIQIDLNPFTPRVRNRILHGYEEPEKRMCQEFLRATDSVLEIGGGIGFIGLFCQKKLGVKSYLTIEANPNTIEILKGNYRLNGVMPAVWNYAVSETSGSVSMNVSGDFWGHFVALAKRRTPGTTLLVPALTFDELLQRAGPGYNVLIIDVEGAERFIDFCSLPQDFNKIIIELHPDVIGRKKTDGILSQLSKTGFRVACEEGNTFAFLKNP